MFKFILNWFRKRRSPWSSIAVPEKKASMNFLMPQHVHIHWHVSDMNKISQNVIWNAGQLVVSDSMPIEIKSHQYNEYLLDSARTQWQFGDWESLIKIERETLQHHPDRAKLALLAAAGHMQQGDIQVARQFVRLAQDWGCSKKLVTQVLVSGVYNTLGRAEVINNKNLRAEYFFEVAIGNDIKKSKIVLLVQNRIHEQYQKILCCCDSIMIDSSQSISSLNWDSKKNILENQITIRNVADLISDEYKDLTGVNVIIAGIKLTKKSQERWPYFIKIEELQLSVFLHLISEIKPILFLDIGANVGFYTLIAKKYFLELQCIAFEPNPETFLNLINNLEENCINGSVEAKCVALSSVCGEVEFGDWGHCSGKNSILSTTIHKQDDLEIRMPVITESLDSLYSDFLGCIIVKIDTEGHEIEIIKGGKNLFRNNKVVLQIETGHKGNFDELDKLIRDENLELLFRLGPDSYYTNISGLLDISKSLSILEKANQFVISHRWNLQQNFS